MVNINMLCHSLFLYYFFGLKVILAHLVAYSKALSIHLARMCDFVVVVKSSIKPLLSVRPYIGGCRWTSGLFLAYYYKHLHAHHKQNYRYSAARYNSLLQLLPESRETIGRKV